MTDTAVRVLTIDDEAGIRNSIAAYLEDSGFEVLQAENGQQGIEICRTDPPDLVLCDLRMPEIDGLEVLEIVISEQPEIPFIVVSGMGGLGDAIDALKLGAWDYITKPIPDMAVLEHAINQSLERSRLLLDNERYQVHLEEANLKLKRNLRQLQADEEAGRKMQFQLLPDDELVINGCHFSRRLLPSTYLSGDFVDYFKIDEHRLGFYIADVSGHGVSSAFVTVLLNSYMSRYLEDFWQANDDVICKPSDLLERLNRVMLDSRVEKYLTMFYGVIDTDKQSMCFSNAGHFPYPILYDSNQAQYLDCKNKPVGLFAETRYPSQEVSLSAEFVMVLFSDGVFEALPQANLEEKEAFLLSLANREVNNVDALLAASTVTDNNQTLPDDVTLLMIKRN